MINIPERFLDILKRNISCETSVNKTIMNVRPIFEDNKLVFFPEYTNHGERHINSVLLIASKIIDNSTYNLLNPFDIEVLINSIIFHDLGMHISYAGFIYIIENGEFSENNIYGDSNWSILWGEYIKEAKKWNPEKIKDIFGNVVKIDNIPKDEMTATKMHKLLIGEFLRRYHHKLAYDIAMKGMPANGSVIDCLTTSDDVLRKIVAHTSRSHGTNLWNMVDYMKEEYDSPRIAFGVKLIFIMSVLRISDYFDIDKSRANKVIWNMNKLSGRISIAEWAQHNCIESIEFDYQEDSESLFIRVNKPSNSGIFLKINKFVKELQLELDTTWAVMGKVYARYDDFKISFRRVYSNLQKLKKEVPYVTKKIQIDVNRNILFSLAQPLYGKNPSYGIRELLQNASDACHERKAISKGHYSPKITIEIQDEEKSKRIIIRDNGIGMDENVIINYFLVAGSSFREDIEWKNRFILDEQKIVIRNGKFGVGVIAAFLLGEKIEVETTHIDNDIVFSFSASLNMKQIELTHKKRLDEEFGTKITIEADENIISILKKQWDEGWVHYSYYYNSDDTVPWFEWYKSADIDYKIIVPNEWRKRDIDVIDETNANWHIFSTKDFEQVKWMYTDISRAYRLLCNGIIIPRAYRIEGYDFPYSIDVPLMSVVDRDGKLPLDLSRSGLEENTLPFEKDFMRKMYEDLLDNLDICDGLSRYNVDKFYIRRGSLAYPGIGNNYNYNSIYGIRPEELIFNKAGYCLCYDYSLRKLKDKKLTKIWVEERFELTNKDLLLLMGENVVISQGNLPNSIDSYKACLDMNMLQELGNTYKFVAKIIIMKKKKYNYLFEVEKNRMRSGFIDEIQVLSENQEWVCLGTNNISKPIDLDKLGDLSGIHLIVQYQYEIVDNIQEQYGKPVRDKEKIKMLNEILEERYKGNIFIPYNNSI